MVLDNFIPNKNQNWVVNKGQVLYKNYGINVPILYIENDIVYVYLDNSIHRPVIQMISYLLKSKVKFYLVPPSWSHPADERLLKSMILHYFRSYSNKHFFYGFLKINFDLIQNLVDFCKQENCIPLIKECYDEVNKVIQKRYYDYYVKKMIYSYPDDIVEAFVGLYRDIQISLLL